jgi:cupin 2 domain-containing protein
MKNTSSGNIFADIPGRLGEELFQDILDSDICRIERIVSCGQSSPGDFWYDQETDEWVILIQGRAVLSFEGGEALEMNPGDYVYIPSHRKHRVAWTDPDQKTIWLAVHFRRMEK